jgi:hypothetical protein
MGMRLNDISPLRTLPKTIEAVRYNRVRLALLRLGSPLRVELPRLQLDMLLERQAWIAFCLWQQNFPMLAWTEFDARQRAGLHEPVHCCLRLYHVHAGLLMGVALDAMDVRLAERLAHA